MLNKIGDIPKRLIVPLSFTLLIFTFYLFNPSSFESVWKGRAPYLIFLWLLFLELGLAWKKLPNKSLSIPTTAITTAVMNYLVGMFAFALNNEIMEFGKLVGVPYQEHGEWILEGWSVSVEYVVLTVCFVISVLLLYRIDGLKLFSISTFFLGATSCFYMIDTFIPFGLLNILQGFVPLIASSAAGILNWLGYATQVLSPERILELYKTDPKGMWGLDVHGLNTLVLIAWGCAGVQSLFIYTFVILFFVKGASISLRRKVLYVAIGAIGTFFVNLLRIVSICLIGVHISPEALKMFHEYYGELFFIVWIIVYFLLIIYGSRILTKLVAFASKLRKSLIAFRRTN